MGLDFFDFKNDPSLSKLFAESYIRQYYPPERPVTNDEAAIYRFIVRVSPRLAAVRTAIEVGCGPTLHHAIMLAPFVESLEMADYLDENLAHVRRWLCNASGAEDWSRYTRFCVETDGLEPSDTAVLEREALTRKRISLVRPVNILHPEPLGSAKSRYDLVSSFYCTEEVAHTVEAWEEVLASLCSLVRPGGYLLLACLANTDFYHIHLDDRSTRVLPCAKVSHSDLIRALRKLGFAGEESVIEEFATPEQAGEGVPGILIALARKSEKGKAR